MIRHASREPAGSGESAVRQRLEQQPDESADEALWNDAYQRNLFHWAAERIKPEFRETTWRAFWMTAVEGQDIDAVAAELQMTRGAIYIARSRIVARLRLEIEAVEGKRE
jgi:RNA polymerase sigma-70 factor (ECF subfamily)